MASTSGIEEHDIQDHGIEEHSIEESGIQQLGTGEQSRAVVLAICCEPICQWHRDWTNQKNKTLVVRCETATPRLAKRDTLTGCPDPVPRSYLTRALWNVAQLRGVVKEDVGSR